MNVRYFAISTLSAGIFLWVLSAPAQQSGGDFDATLRNAGKTGEEWLNYGLTPGETRYSPLRQIDSSNINRLGLAWSYDVGAGGGNQEATPLMWNGTLFSITNWSIVYAVDARTGKEKWRWDPEVNRTAAQPKICCGVVNRGVAIYDGNIIAPIIDGRLIALNAESGRPVWESRVAYTRDNYTLTMAPRIAKGKVIIGVAGGEFPARGYFEAHNARTGEFVWRFYTVPGDPSKPFESEDLRKAAATWDPEGLAMGGGGSVWDGMSYDPDLDLLYVGIGNAGPWASAARKQSKDRDNLYACSVVAVKPDTGKLVWYFQMVPGDDWDYDSVQQLLLADIVISGRQQKVIMQANKNGFYYVLDRSTGKFISGAPFATVTWARGLNEETGRPIVNPEALYGTQPIPIAPGPGGGHNWAPMAFNPATGLVYLPATLSSARTFSYNANFQYREGMMNTGLASGRAPNLNLAGAPANPGTPLPAPPAIGPALTQDGSQSALLAWDPVNQKERWRAPAGGGSGGGALTTAGNLVIQAVPDGRLIAYAADTGNKLLEIDTKLRGGMGPPITYMLDGKQYIALTGGVGGREAAVVPNREAATGDPPPGVRGAAQVNPKLMVFTLDANTTGSGATVP
ncbi:MAG: PQQ-dependent dehydrogenase, methanol/ethanol family [Bryobacterales bacterium]|nr:PQQ-dependent dehydrogenase, methanol/ethanol family [Bryobacterales bacterium]